MCGIIGVVATTPVNQLLYDGLMVLQHRGQDAAGISTAEGSTFHMHKGPGLVRDVFRTRNMRALPGNWGIAHCRYPTAGSAYNFAEAQPFYVNSPFGLMLAHNGNLTNADALKQQLFKQDLRHINTNSDSEVLLNVLAHELQKAAHGTTLDQAAIFKAVRGVHQRVRGAYAVVAMIAGYGLLAFRDPYGIRPLVLGKNETPDGPEWMLASESVPLDTLGFERVDDVAPGEAVFVDLDRSMAREQCAARHELSPCLFEYVYLARPDSMQDGVSVYETRLRMGESLAVKVRKVIDPKDIDVVIPIPDSSRPAALQMAQALNIPFREGFVKNRYIGRTFIMPGQSTRKKSVRQKLNTVAQEFAGKNVMLVDDSIVRGTTSHEIVEMARAAGAKKVYFASASPPVRFPNVYGIDMPAVSELIAHGKTVQEVQKAIGADWLVFQDLEDLIASCAEGSIIPMDFECSVFNGDYVTSDVSEAYLSKLEERRNDAAKRKRVSSNSGATDNTEDEDILELHNAG